ncbi:phosphoglycerate dehydrogenase [Papillibacter cinnamivorans]|uniref:D-3-phosphoglycerate dehydrogenase n=1 Tax=Papillibacter cinnamivorans DSM 12816 TaxID=1122930 RepID=A0A1W2A4R5_9FIRM|nr:phosphoglycerate dehydrogenase [Papillibacter cinnamivorans]SMC55667.1 D-3-phosphoglycerate dehydrogenase [Papillibacter cinnamivorans DSM 12816]
MFRIKTLNRISPAGLSKLDNTRFSVGDETDNPDGILVRSSEMGDYVFPDTLRAIARAGAGTNNIPVARCSEAGIVVFNTPGANANAVKELVLCSLFLSSRKIVSGIDWVKQLARKGEDVAAAVEKGKAAFVGPELEGKSLGIVGLGAVGVQVANVAVKLGMKVYGYDPFLSVEHALNLTRSIHRVMDLESIYKTCDYITLHVPLNPETKGMINTDSIHMMKGHVRIINLARGELVDTKDILEALETGKVGCYITDFPNNDLALAKNVVAIPHLGASTPESEDNCAAMAAMELKDYLENGNIKNSVNLPDVSMEFSGMDRLCVIHKNIPNMLGSIISILSPENMNIENMVNKSKKDYAYTMLDVNSKVPENVIDKIKAVEGVLRVRVIHH